HQYKVSAVKPILVFHESIKMPSKNQSIKIYCFVKIAICSRNMIVVAIARILWIRGTSGCTSRDCIRIRSAELLLSRQLEATSNQTEVRLGVVQSDSQHV